MDTPKIHESEYRFCLILWEHEPVTAVELVKLCQEQLGWKRTTTYTVIKRLSERGVLKNEDGTVTSLVSKDAAQEREINELVEEKFQGSLPAFIAAFTKRQDLSEKEADMSEFFLKIVNMSISASWLVLAVLLLRLILKKAPKWVNVLLWGIVAIRLVCPFSIESVFSLIPSAETVSPEIMMDRTPEISTGIDSFDAVVNPIITESFAPQPMASANPLQIWIPVSANFWLLGIGIMLIYTAISYLLLRRKVATAIRLEGNIYQSENVVSPFVLGIIKPKIYLPFRMDAGNLQHVIAHEQAHIRRKDHLWKPLGFLLLAIHWFNPMMWLGYIFLCKDIELACDEKVVKKLTREERADYSNALLFCSVSRRAVTACPSHSARSA